MTSTLNLIDQIIGLTAQKMRCIRLADVTMDENVRFACVEAAQLYQAEIDRSKVVVDEALDRPQGEH